MSKLIVEIKDVKNIKLHPNADKLEVAEIGGWEVVVQKGLLNKGDLVVYIPPDSILPKSLHEHLGITKYCAELPTHYEQHIISDANDGYAQSEIMHCLYEDTDPQTVVKPTARRVKAARLRGEASYGTIITMNSFHEYLTKLDQEEYIEHFCDKGSNVAQVLHICKWEPPVKSTQGDVAKDHLAFHKYTDIENWRNYPDVFTSDDVVIMTEKINGTNSRLGFIPTDNIEEKESLPYIYVAGSHNTRRKKPDSENHNSLYWMPYKLVPNLKIMMFDLWDIHNKASIVVFGEIYGAGIQDMHYDRQNDISFRAFDISIDGQYMNYEKYKWFKKYEIPYVPILYTGPYSKEKVLELTDGETTLGTHQKFKGREGVVITHSLEETDPLIGRKILKSISVDYLSRKNATDSH